MFRMSLNDFERVSSECFINMMLLIHQLKIISLENSDCETNCETNKRSFINGIELL